MQNLRSLWAREPVLIATLIASAVVFVAAKLGAVVSEQSVLNAVLLIVPILLGGLGARGAVHSPATVARDVSALLSAHDGEDLGEITLPGDDTSLKGADPSLVKPAPDPTAPALTEGHV